MLCPSCDHRIGISVTIAFPSSPQTYRFCDECGEIFAWHSGKAWEPVRIIDIVGLSVSNITLLLTISHALINNNKEGNSVD